MTGKEIRALREKMGLSREDFAHQIGTTGMTVYRWEMKGRKPTKMAQRLLEQLRVKVENEETATMG